MHPDVRELKKYNGECLHENGAVTVQVQLANGAFRSETRCAVCHHVIHAYLAKTWWG